MAQTAHVTSAYRGTSGALVGVFVISRVLSGAAFVLSRTVYRGINEGKYSIVETTAASVAWSAPPIQALPRQDVIRTRFVTAPVLPAPGVTAAAATRPEPKADMCAATRSSSSSPMSERVREDRFPPRRVVNVPLEAPTRLAQNASLCQVAPPRRRRR